MGLSEYITDLGRPIAFYPKLKRVTGSTTATILLCQLLYWSDKSKDGWIWKTSSQLEEETGLTENEQRTARKKLEDAGILESQYMRLEHMIKYHVNKKKLNALWEDPSFENLSNENVAPEGEEVTNAPVGTENINNSDESVSTESSVLFSTPKIEKRIISDKETLDELEKVILSPAMKKSWRIREMQDLTESKIHINTRGRKWQQFYEYAYRQETEHGYRIETFLEWLINKDNFDPMYWGPDKMETMYPQAFVERQTEKGEDTFIAPLPSIDKENYAPMPKEAKVKRNLI